jgi:hypothetical protein
LPVPARPPRETVQPEEVAVAADQSHFAAGRHPAEGRAAIRVDDEPGVDGRVADLPRGEFLRMVELRHLLGIERHVLHARPPGIDGEFCTVFLGGETDRGGLHAQRQVLRHDRHVEAVVGEVEGDGEDARVVVVQLQPRGQHRHVRVVEFDSKRTAVTDGDRKVESLVLHAQLVEIAQGLTGEIADLRIVALAFEFRDHHHRQHHRMLGEAEDRLRVGQQDRRVEHVCALGLLGGSVRSPRCASRRGWAGLV